MDNFKIVRSTNPNFWEAFKEVESQCSALIELGYEPVGGIVIERNVSFSVQKKDNVEERVGYLFPIQTMYRSLQAEAEHDRRVAEAQADDMRQVAKRQLPKYVKGYLAIERLGDGASKGEVAFEMDRSLRTLNRWISEWDYYSQYLNKSEIDEILKAAGVI